MIAADSPLRLRNVKLFFYITTTMLSIWSFSFGATFDAYLLELAKARGDSNPNEFVGSVETVRGLVALFLALPLGVIADKVNRRKLLQWSCMFGTAGVVLLASGILMDSVWLIYSGVVVCATFMQIYMSCGQALLADSVPKENLTAVIAAQQSLFLIGYSVGPLAQIALIANIGDTWSLALLHIFLCTGFCFWPLVVPAFFLFEPTRAERQSELTDGLTGGRPAAGASNSAAAPGAAAQQAASTAGTSSWNTQRVLGVQKKWLVPLMIEFCSLITAMGAGMTVKFFPLFFKQDYKFDPIDLNALQASYTLAIALFVQFCRMLSSKIGRCQAALMWHLLGTACLFLLWKAESLPLVLFLYIIRGSFMNAKGPIDQAIVMDCVDTKFRGRWSALQSISRFSWSGSAILGGLLADSHDYRYTFFITGVIYASSAVIYSPLIFLVPAKSAQASSTPAASGKPPSNSVQMTDEEASTAVPSEPSLSAAPSSVDESAMRNTASEKS